MFGIGDKALAIAGGAGSVILAGVLTFVWIDKSATIRSLEKQNENLSTQLDTTRSSLTTCRANRITLEEATKRQNDAVRVVRIEGERRIARLERQLQSAAERTREAEEAAERILATPGTGDICADADALILGEVE